jgi:hypothetical protein
MIGNLQSARALIVLAAHEHLGRPAGAMVELRCGTCVLSPGAFRADRFQPSRIAWPGHSRHGHSRQRHSRYRHSRRADRRRSPTGLHAAGPLPVNRRRYRNGRSDAWGCGEDCARSMNPRDLLKKGPWPRRPAGGSLQARTGGLVSFPRAMACCCGRPRPGPGWSPSRTVAPVDPRRSRLLPNLTSAGSAIGLRGYVAKKLLRCSCIYTHS